METKQKGNRTKVLLCAIILILAACAAGAVALKKVIIPRRKYNAAVAKFGASAVSEINALHRGDSYLFGAFEQDGNTDNGAEKIEWIVVDKDGGKALLVSKYALDCRAFHTRCENVNWDGCALRKWLNEEFLQTAFSEEEQALIRNTRLTAEEELPIQTPTGNDTFDRVFLLSYTEAGKYFGNDADRACKPTAYASSRGVWMSGKDDEINKDACWWWLRSPGRSQKRAIDVRGGGAIDIRGLSVNDNSAAVRPALWVSVET